MRNSWIIARRELKSFFDVPAAYVLLVVFIAVTLFFYFRGTFLSNEASMRALFELLPWVLLFFVPAATMRSIAAERREGTIEILFTQPLRDWEVLLGKFAGNTLFVLIALALTIPAALALKLGGDPEYGVIVAQYVGAVLFVGAAVAVGLFSSALTRNQTIAFIIGLLFLFILLAIGLPFVAMGIPSPLDRLAAELSLLTHFQTITRGVIDLRDVLYFITLAGAFLSLTYLLLLREKINRKSPQYRTLQAGVATLVGISLLVSLLGGYIGGRLDFTSAKLYTLSPASVRMLSSLPDLVTVTFYTSKQLPAEVALTERDVRDMLLDYEKAANGKLRLRFKNPDADEKARSEAEQAGVQTVQFNVLGQDEFQVKQGWIGIAVRYADKTEAIPVVEETDRLEYKLSSLIRKLTLPEQEKKKVVFLSLEGTRSLDQEISLFKQQLETQYKVEEFKPNAKKRSAPKGTDVLVVAGGSGKLSAAEKAVLEDYLASGGKAFLMVDKVSVFPQAMFAQPVKSALADLLAKRGIRVEDDLIYDLRAHENVTFGGGSGQSYIAPYPMWIRAQGNPDQNVIGDVNGVVMPWASSIETGKAPKSLKVELLLATTRFAGRQTGSFNISPTNNPQIKDVGLRSYPLAVAVSGLGKSMDLKGDSSDKAERTGNGRAVVVGDTDFITNQYVEQGPQNLAFALNAVDWLAQEDSLAGIRAKQAVPRPLVFGSETTKNIFRYTNMVGIALVVALFGLARLTARRRRSREVFTP